MLVLTRKIGERIVIGENIVITIADIKGDNVRLAIDAPKEIKIYRGEIFDSIAIENKHAATHGTAEDWDMLKEIKIK